MAGALRARNSPFSLFTEATLNGTSRNGTRRGKGLAQLETPPRFDLLIVDEAHHARNADTNLHQGLRILADNAEAVVFVTATPVQLGDDDLFSLLNLLRPDLVIDKPTFTRMAEPNPAINARGRRRALGARSAGKRRRWLRWTKPPTPIGAGRYSRLARVHCVARSDRNG